MNQFAATVTQVDDKALRPGQRLLLKYGTTTTRVIVGAIDHLLDIDTLTPLAGAPSLAAQRHRPGHAPDSGGAAGRGRTDRAAQWAPC